MAAQSDDHIISRLMLRIRNMMFQERCGRDKTQGWTWEWSLSWDQVKGAKENYGKFRIDDPPD